MAKKNNPSLKKCGQIFTKAILQSLLKKVVVMLNNSNKAQVTSYVQQHAMINRIFTTEMYDIGTIMLRLTVIDSLYSTNAAYSYFSLDELAEKIYALGSETDAEEYFYSIACGKPDTKGIFSNVYGIRKNLDSGSRQTSLVSKYAYYCLQQKPISYPLGFPIYDKLAANTYPKVCRNLGITPYKDFTSNVEKYVAALNELRKNIFDDDNLFMQKQQFDVLDAYLWRIGKIDKGNYSLLFDKKGYETFITNIGLKGDSSSDFVKKVSELCRKLNINNIVNGIDCSNNAMDELIVHWKRYY